MKIIVNKWFYTIICTFFTVTSCSGQKVDPTYIPVDGKLVYVEGLQGKGWITANPFGELVMLDSKAQQRHVLTWDKYYYAFPNLTTDGKYIIFESKRADNIKIVGLSVDSDIYRMDLETQEITNINKELSKIAGEPIGHRVTHPSLSPSDNKLAMVRLVDWDFRLPYIDFKKEKIVDLTVDERFQPNSVSTLTWSDDEQQLLYSRTKGFLTSVVLISLDEKQPNIIRPKLNEIKKQSEVASCIAGSWKDKYRFVYQCKRSEMNYTDIYEYDLRNKESRILSSLDNDSFKMMIKSLKVNKEGNSLLFIGINSDTKTNDVWKMSIESGVLTRITSNGNAKEWLRWYEDM